MWRRQEQPAAVPGQRPALGLERLVIRLLVMWLLVIWLLALKVLVEIEPELGQA